MRIFLCFIFTCKVFYCFAQITDNFERTSLEAGELVWFTGKSTGVTGGFLINNQELQAVFDNGSGTREAWISTAIPSTEQQYVFEWQFKVKLDFGSLSSSLSQKNKSRIYLISQNQDLNSEPNGYFLEFKPVANQDSMSCQFFYTVRGEEFLLSEEEVAINTPTYDFANIKVKRRNGGNWEIWVNDNLQEEIQNSLYLIDGYFGAKVYFSSAAREDKFFFDDFSFIKYPYIDSMAVVDNNRIQLTFSFSLDAGIANEVSNYQLNSSTTPISAIVEENQVILEFESPFDEGFSNNLHITNLSDTEGNALPDSENLSISFIYDAPDVYAPKIVNVKGLQDSLIIIQFDEEIKAESLTTENFLLFPANQNPIEVIADTANSYVLQFAEEFQIDSTYELAVIDLSDNLGNTIEDTLLQAFTFQDRIPPNPTNLGLINSNTLLVYFSEELDSIAVNDISNYTYSGDIHPELAILENGNNVRLFFAKAFEENTELELNIESVKDVSQNVMDEPWETSFVYDTEKPNVATSGSVFPLSDTVLKVIFTEEVDSVSAKIVNNYLLRSTKEDVFPVDISIDSTDESIVYLLFKTPFESETEYDIRISAVADKSGNVMNTRTRSFYFDARPPFISNYRLFPDNKIELRFNEVPLINPSEDSLNFRVDDIYPNRIEQLLADGKVIYLEFDSLPKSELTLLVIADIEDYQDNKMDFADTILLNTWSPEMARINVLSSKVIEIEFSMQLDSLQSLFPQNFIVYDSIYPEAVEILGSKVMLSFRSSFKNGEENLIEVTNIKSLEETLSENLTDTFTYFYPIISASIKDDYQIELVYREALLADSLKLEMFTLDDDLHPVKIFADDEALNTIMLLFDQAFLANSKYHFQVDFLYQQNLNIVSSVKLILEKDESAPEILKAKFQSQNEISIYFSEKLLQSNALALNHYELILDGVKSYPDEIELLDDSIVNLSFDAYFEAEAPYKLTVKNISDLFQNQLKSESITLTFPVIPKRGEIIINEIIADPTPTVGLPDAEFIEIMNVSDKTQNLLHIKLKDETGEFSLGERTLQPNEILILCHEDFAKEFEVFGTVQALKSFPSISNSGETLSLLSSNNEVIDEVHFNDSWYTEIEKKDGGWSIERILSFYDCKEADNWRAAISIIGGTPGKANSVKNATPDTLLPKINLVKQVSSNEILLGFNEEMDTVLSSISGALLLNESDGLIESFNWLSKDSLFITCSKSFEAGVLNQLEVSGMVDCAGNVMENKSVVFGDGKKPNYHEVIITEIMADPEPLVGLPEYEYLEIFNATDFLIDLNGCVLSDVTSTTTLSGYIQPNQFKLLCSSTAAASFISEALIVNNFPSLNNSGERLTIWNEKGEIVYTVNYNDDWYKESDKSEGGYSLEMIDVDFPCGGEENWTASVNVSGGTPGNQNSIQNTITDHIPPEIEQVYLLDSMHISIQFNEKMDSISLANATYQISPFVEIGNISVTTAFDFKEAVLSLKEELSVGQSYQIAVKNMQDCSGNTAASFSTQQLIIPEKAEENDILLSEILFNPPVNGVDFIELYNNSEKFIDLKSSQLANGKGEKITFEDQVFMKPYGFLVLTEDVTSLKTNYPAVPDSVLLEFDLPSFNDDEGHVFLINSENDTVQFFEYDENMHNSLLNDYEGVSLERIDYNVDVNDVENWHSAAQSVGFATPGKTNSQWIGNHELSQNECFYVEPKVFSPDLDGVDDFVRLYYDCQNQGTISNIWIYDANGRLIRHLIKNESIATNGFFQWDGTKENGEKAPIGYYLIKIEAFDLDGNKFNPKPIKLVLAGKF